MSAGGDVWVNGGNGVLRNGAERSGTLGRRRSKSGPKRVTFKLESDSPPPDGSHVAGSEPTDGMPSWWPRPSDPGPGQSAGQTGGWSPAQPAGATPTPALTTPTTATTPHGDRGLSLPAGQGHMVGAVWYPNVNGAGEGPRGSSAPTAPISGRIQGAPSPASPIAALNHVTAAPQPIGRPGVGGATPGGPMGGERASVPAWWPKGSAANGPPEPEYYDNTSADWQGAQQPAAAPPAAGTNGAAGVRPWERALPPLPSAAVGHPPEPPSAARPAPGQHAARPAGRAEFHQSPTDGSGVAEARAVTAAPATPQAEPDLTHPREEDFLSPRPVRKYLQAVHRDVNGDASGDVGGRPPAPRPSRADSVWSRLLCAAADETEEDDVEEQGGLQGRYRDTLSRTLTVTPPDEQQLRRQLLCLKLEQQRPQQQQQQQRQPQQQQHQQSQQQQQQQQQLQQQQSQEQQQQQQERQQHITHQWQQAQHQQYNHTDQQHQVQRELQQHRHQLRPLQGPQQEPSHHWQQHLQQQQQNAHDLRRPQHQKDYQEHQEHQLQQDHHHHQQQRQHREEPQYKYQQQQQHQWQQQRGDFERNWSDQSSSQEATGNGGPWPSPPPPRARDQLDSEAGERRWDSFFSPARDSAAASPRGGATSWGPAGGRPPSSVSPPHTNGRPEPAAPARRRWPSFQQSFASPPGSDAHLAPPSPAPSDGDRGRGSPSPLDDELEICLKSVEEAMASLQQTVNRNDGRRENGAGAQRQELNRSFDVAPRGGGASGDWRRRSFDGAELESFSRRRMWRKTDDNDNEQKAAEQRQFEADRRVAPTPSFAVLSPLQHNASHLWTAGENSSSNWTRLVVGDWLLGSHHNRHDVVSRQIALWEGQPLEQGQGLRRIGDGQDRGYSSPRRGDSRTDPNESEDFPDQVGSQISRIGLESRQKHRDITERILPSNGGHGIRASSLQRQMPWRSYSQSPAPSLPGDRASPQRKDSWRPDSTMQSPPSPWQREATPPLASSWRRDASPPLWSGYDRQSADVYGSTSRPPWSGHGVTPRHEQQPQLDASPWQRAGPASTSHRPTYPWSASPASTSEEQRSSTLADGRSGSGFGRLPAFGSHPRQSATLPAGQPWSPAEWPTTERRDHSGLLPPPGTPSSPGAPQVAALGGRRTAPLSPSGSVISIDWNQLFDTSSERSSGLEDDRSSVVSDVSLRPPSRAEVVRWYHAVELPRGAGVDALTGRAAPWFHGLVGRAEAEQRLLPCPPGAFLVRCSLKIWGYTLSYRSQQRCKHFLVEAADAGYRFYGNPERCFRSVDELLRFHTIQPITTQGAELLRFPCTNHTNTTAAQLVV